MNQIFAGLPLEKSDHLLQIFEAIHDYIYANDGLSTQQTLEEFVKILFIKIFDEKSDNQQFFITTAEWDNLQEGKDNLSFLGRINQLFITIKQEYFDIFDPTDRINLSSITLGFTVNKLQDISLSNSSYDSKGLAFQKIISHQEKDGHGQFFTPHPVIDLCVEILQPQPEETIMDPACGSGGFLISALKYLTQKFTQINKSEIIANHLFGVDINKSIARIAKMKLLLEYNTKPNIYCANALENLADLKSHNLLPNGFDIILTNPPFGATGKIKNTEILSQYNLGYKWKNLGDKFTQTKKLSNAQTAEILFIERCLQLLKEGGRMGIVLPNGHLENPSLEYLRYYLKQTAKLLGIINLPDATFIPYGTGVKTSLLFLQKEISLSNYRIFFGQVKKLGYQGNKNANPIYQKDQFGQIIRDEKGQPIVDEDFSMVRDDYHQFQLDKLRETNNAFFVNIRELNGRFDYDFYAPQNRQILAKVNYEKRVFLGDIAEIVKTKSKKLKDPQKSVEYVEVSDINTYSFEIINTTNYLVHELPSRASYELEIGDIITAIAGNSVGTRKHAIALVTEEFAGCICTNGFRVLRNFKIDPYFLLYFFRSELFLSQMFRYRTGAAIPNVSDKNLGKIIIYLPDQKGIEYISHKVKKSFELRRESQQELASIQDIFWE